MRTTDHQDEPVAPGGAPGRTADDRRERSPELAEALVVGGGTSSSANRTWSAVDPTDSAAAATTADLPELGTPARTRASVEARRTGAASSAAMSVSVGMRVGLALLAIGLLAAPGVAQAAALAPPTVPVQAASTSWTSSQHGWVLGARACPAGRCTTVARTVDAGRSWQRVAAPAAALAPSGGQGVDTVRFADDANGWALHPQLHATHDGGTRWRRLPVPGGGRQVVALAAANGSAYAVVSSCVVGNPSSCSGPSRLFRSDVAGDAWERVPLTLPAQGDAELQTSNRTVYVVVQGGPGTPHAFAATVDGATWTPRPWPCADGESLRVAPETATAVSLLCSENVRPGVFTKRVLRSTDTARTSREVGSAPESGLPVEFAAVRPGVLALGVTGGASALLRSPDRGRRWSTVFTADPAGLADLTLRGTTGALVRDPAQFGGTGQLLLSRDRGTHWAQQTIRVR